MILISVRWQSVQDPICDYAGGWSGLGPGNCHKAQWVRYVVEPSGIPLADQIASCRSIPARAL